MFVIWTISPFDGDTPLRGWLFPAPDFSPGNHSPTSFKVRGGMNVLRGCDLEGTCVKALKMPLTSDRG